MQTPVDMPKIPAMTTDAEREFYYRLVLEHAHEGAVVELGAWLGASTAYIAAAMRDAGVNHKAQVYDHFISKPGHATKVREWCNDHDVGDIPVGPAFEDFQANLGPLLDYVQPHMGAIEGLKWNGSKIAILITDAPKRVPAISNILMKFRDALQPGSIMAWQDFCHFPSYEIPACLYLLRDHWRFVEAVVPGTTLAFEVTAQWSAAEVSADALALSQWTHEAIRAAWRDLLLIVPREKQALFMCGAAMFLCDTGEKARAVSLLGDVFEDAAEAILPKWRYLHKRRPDFVKRYAPLFNLLDQEGVLMERAE